jgi:hypothetical protein
MTQRQLDREVAHTTGESLATIRRHGFSLTTPLGLFDPDSDGVAEPQIVDWDEVEADRRWSAA